jgi:hypothetical protein
MSGIKRVYPMLVTLDDLGGTLLLTRLLNRYFDKWVDRRSRATINLMPLFCTNIESLEAVLPFSDVCRLSGFLQHWLDSDPKLIATLLAFPPEGLPSRRNEMLYAEWQRISDEFKSRLFPSEDLSSLQQ